jgi:hypothetical protein
MIGDVDCLMARLYEKEQALRARISSPHHRQAAQMTDIVERLRLPGKATRELQDEAADEIERLQAEIKRGRMFRVKLWDALRELADLVKDEA